MGEPETEAEDALAVGELFTWGQRTGGSKQDLLAFRSCRVSARRRLARIQLLMRARVRTRAPTQILKLTGQFDGACVLYEVRKSTHTFLASFGGALS